MSFFIMFLITVIDAVAVAYIAKRSFGRTIAIVNMSLIFILYFCGLFLRLDAGEYLFFALSFALVVLAIVLVVLRKDAKQLFEIIKNPMFILYASLGILIGIIFLFKSTYTIDDMTHWALVVKNMLTYNNFGNIGDTTTMFNRYVPATGVFMYGFAFLNKGFVYGNLLAAYDMLFLSFLLPIADKFGKEKPVHCMIAIAFPILFFTLLKPDTFMCLQVDMIIGVMAAYIYISYMLDRGNVNAFTIVEIALCSFTLTATKSSGLALAAIAFVIIIVDVLTRGRQNIRPFFSKKLNFVLILLPIVALIYAKVSWNLYCDINNVRAGWDTSELTMSSLWAYMTTPNDFQQEVTNLFFKTFFVGKIEYIWGSLQQPFLLILPLFAIPAVFLIRRQKAYGIGLSIATFVVLFVYAIINLMLYIFSFSYWEALHLASWQRYYNTAIVLMATIWLASMLDTYEDKLVFEKKPTKYIWLSMAATYAIVMIVLTVVGSWRCKVQTQKIYAKYGAWVEATSTLKDTDHVYYVTDKGAQEYYFTRYFATPVRSNGWYQGGSYSKGRDYAENGGIYVGDPFKPEFTLEEFEDAIKDYDYLFIDEVYEGFVDKYGSLFDSAPVAKTLYIIHHTTSGTIISLN